MASERAYQDDQWLSRKEAARFLCSIGCPVTWTSLAHKAANQNAGGGPPYTVTGHRTIRYLVADLRAWAAKAARRVS